MLNFAEWKQRVERLGLPEQMLIANALEAAKPIIDRNDRHELDDDEEPCLCEMCVQDRAAKAAFAEIDFSGLVSAST